MFARHTDDHTGSCRRMSARPVRRRRIDRRFSRLGLLPRRDGGPVLEELGRRQRAEADQALLVRPDVPDVPVEAVDGQVGEDHPHLVAGLALERDAGLFAHDAVAAVAADQPPRGDGLGHAVRDDSRRQALARLLESGQRGAEPDPAAELGEPQPQRLLGAPLGRDQTRRIGDVGPVQQRGGHVAAPRHPPVGGGRTHRHRHPAVDEHPLGDPEILEDLQGARLHALAARAGPRPRGGLDQAEGDVPAGQLAGEGEPSRAGADDQHLRGIRPPRRRSRARAPGHPGPLRKESIS
jgi:hypothetical protein